MSPTKCRTCGALFPLPNHRCPPRWFVWFPMFAEDIEDAVTVYAETFACAAEAAVNDDPRRMEMLVGMGWVEGVAVRNADTGENFEASLEIVTTHRAYNRKTKPELR